MSEIDIKKIRNFSIIAHIDHGKSTLADRMLEMTQTVEKRKMKDQVLDQMDLERERGITIKMQPVRMVYRAENHTEVSSAKYQVPSKTQAQNSNSKGDSLGFRDSDLGFANSEFILNLIDTPGHIDFAYEVSRALKAVEGTLLLVDATQGVQAQTLSVLQIARDLNLVIIPVISKVDSPLAEVDKVKNEISELLEVDRDEILEVSGKTGEGVPDLLNSIVEKIPEPKTDDRNRPISLVFDFEYSDHRGVILYVRLFEGKISKNDKLQFKIAGNKFNSGEVGVFSPEKKPVETLNRGEIGYIVTGIKEPGIVSVGDTVVLQGDSSDALSGYENPQPVVWASVFPESQDDFDELRQALLRLRLIDSSLSFEEESSHILGRGFRMGFLGMLHLEIIIERIRREYDLGVVVTSPSISYEVKTRDGKQETIYSPAMFPEHGEIEEVKEPWILAKVITPAQYVGDVLNLFYEYEGEVGHTEVFGDGRNALYADMPLRELMRGFFDALKSATSGFASLSYERGEMKDANVAKLEVLVAEEPVPAFTKIVSRDKVDEEARKTVERLHELLPKQLFSTKIQGKALGRIIASKTLPAMRKDVTGHLYGGDVTRKKKLLEKQKKGKKKMKEQGKVNIPQETFVKMMKGSH